ncbi:MAG: dolichyl-phosphate mannose synthase [Pirellulaceae bacterium]|nr:MAG: dolichyl-phosphate mannose synthase [Pirellulaceae bacterium]
MTVRTLTALPVYNEEKYLPGVLAEVLRYAEEVLVVDDGSTDRTPQILDSFAGIHRVRHAANRGYGAALRSAFRFAIRNRYDVLVTIDCDGQHEPRRIPRFIRVSRYADIVSGSRYMKPFAGDSRPPEARRRINRHVTHLLNQALGLHLTDAFCGFKAYRVAALKALRLTEDGYAMPLELWVQAAAAGLSILEIPVPLIYLDEARSFGGALDNAAFRLQHYYQVLERSLESVGWQERFPGKRYAAWVRGIGG